MQPIELRSASHRVHTELVALTDLVEEICDVVVSGVFDGEALDAFDALLDLLVDNQLLVHCGHHHLMRPGQVCWACERLEAERQEEADDARQ